MPIHPNYRRSHPPAQTAPDHSELEEPQYLQIIGAILLLNFIVMVLVL
jgi:hypothetical protein